MKFNNAKNYEISLATFFLYTISIFVLPRIFPDLYKDIFNIGLVLNSIFLLLLTYFCLKSLHGLMSLEQNSTKVTFLQFSLKMFLGFILFHSVPNIFAFKLNRQVEFEVYNKLIEIENLKIVLGIYSNLMLYLIQIPIKLIGTFYLYTYIAKENIFLSQISILRNAYLIFSILALIVLIFLYTSGLTLIIDNTVITLPFLYSFLYYLLIYSNIKKKQT